MLVNGSTETAEKRQDPRIKRTRELIVRAFGELAKEKGHRGLTVQEITERATLNRATFYDHFRDQYELLDYFMSEAFREELRRRLPESPGLDEESLRALVLATCVFLSGLETSCRTSDRQFRPLIEAQVASEFSEQLLEQIEASPQEANGRPAVPEITASVVSWAVFGARWSRDGAAGSEERFADQVLSVIAGGLNLQGFLLYSPNVVEGGRSRNFAYASQVDVQYDPPAGLASLDRLVGLRDAFEWQAQGDTRLQRSGLQARRYVLDRSALSVLGQVVGADQSDRYVLELQRPEWQPGLRLGVGGVGGYRPTQRDHFGVQGQVPPEGDLYHAAHPRSAHDLPDGATTSSVRQFRAWSAPAPIAAWRDAHRERMEAFEFFAGGGGGFGIFNVPDEATLNRIMVQYPLTPYSEITIRPILDGDTALGQWREIMSEMMDAGPAVQPSHQESSDHLRN